MATATLQREVIVRPRKAGALTSTAAARPL